MSREGSQLIRRFSALITVACLTAPGLVASSGADAFLGQRLEEALRTLQVRGLRVVFTSQLVTHEMRVRVEPKARTPRELLDELLAPHGLVAQTGPGGILQVVKRTSAPQPGPSAREPTQRVPVTRGARPREEVGIAKTFEERVTVIAPLPPADDAAGPDRSLGVRALREFGTGVIDDPLRVIQTLPGASAGDDFRSELSVRGSAYRHAALVVDGVEAQWLRHTAFGRGDSGSLTMLRGDMVSKATLQVGAYPRRDSGQLGPQLNLTLREGSRTERHLSIGVNGGSSTVAAEGPLATGGRGSWIVGLRQSHAEWPIGRDDRQHTVFGYADVQSKIVYDVRPQQQVSMSVVAGRSNIERESPSPLSLSAGLNESALMTLAWRSVLGRRMVVTQRVAAQSHRFLNRDAAARPISRGSDQALGYRVDVTHALGDGAIDVGAQVSRRRGGDYEPSLVEGVARSWLERSAYASLRRRITRNVTGDVGVRLSDSALVGHRALDRWTRVEWSPGSVWRVYGSSGVMHQFPNVDHIRGVITPSVLRPERAAYVDLGFGQQLSSSVRWNVTLFARRERDVLRVPYFESARDTGGQWGVIPAMRAENALAGMANGFEVAVHRFASSGLSGWIGYAHGVARQHDVKRGETFSADLDQRHSLVASGTARLFEKIRVGVTARGGSSVPIPGYFIKREGRLFAGDRPNQVRLPPYMRLDVRVDRTFARRFTVFAEGINILNRVNVGLAEGIIIPDTGEAIGFTERLFPRLVIGGVRLELGSRRPAVADALRGENR